MREGAVLLDFLIENGRYNLKEFIRGFCFRSGYTYENLRNISHTGNRAGQSRYLKGFAALGMEDEMLTHFQKSLDKVIETNLSRFQDY